MKDDKKKSKGKGKTTKKKIEDEKINEEEQTDINEADDTFGLPDVDFKPLDEVDEVVESEETVEEPPDDVPQEVEEDAVVDVASETSESEPEEESSNYPHDDAEAEFEEDNDTEVESDTDSQDEEKDKDVEPAFKKKYKYEKEKSQAPKIIIGIAAILIILAGVWYFGFYAPQQKAIEIATQEAAIAKKKAEDAKALAAEQVRIAEEQRRIAEQAEEEANTKPEPGMINILTEPTGRYYVVVGSFIDDDLAMDYGNELSEKGIGTMLLSPQGSSKFFRLALSDFTSWNEAQEEANGMKGDYTESVWVFKY